MRVQNLGKFNLALKTVKIGAFWLLACCFKCVLSIWRKLNVWVNKVAHVGQNVVIHWCTVTQILSRISENSPDHERGWLECKQWSKWSVNGTPGLGLSWKTLIFKIDGNILYIARDWGPGFAHSGLLTGSSGSCTPVVLLSVPCFDEQSDRLEKSLKVV